MPLVCVPYAQVTTGAPFVPSGVKPALHVYVVLAFSEVFSALAATYACVAGGTVAELQY